MPTKLRTQVTMADIDRLNDAHRILVELMTGLHPSAAAHAPLYAAMVTVRACAMEWSGDRAIWSTANVRLGNAKSPATR